ncbi:MAG: molybdenum cofactor guanylyltransferase [Gammaproteobacteria bacterium]|nr:molybdenum cofactor guanylyltransferase [Gammaproteobacteria bacterium]
MPGNSPHPMTSGGPQPSEAITGIVLCGGEGRRVAGADKPLLNYHGRPLIEWVLDAVKPQVDRLLISTNRNPESYAAYGRVITDELPPYAGPLAGIVSCLRSCPTELAFVCPGDVPHLGVDTVRRLHQAYGESEATVAIAFDGVQRQNLHLFLSRSSIDSLANYLGHGYRSVHGWLDGIAIVEVDFSDQQESFRNLNHHDGFH